MNIRGIDHIGITVPDMEQAPESFVNAFDAIYMYDIIDAPIDGAWLEEGLGVAVGTTIQEIRVLRLGNGPNIELFNYSTTHQQTAARPSDMGYQHVAVFVDDITTATKKLEAAGACILGGGPHDLPGAEAGEACQFLYAITPWGSTIELVTYSYVQAYHQMTGHRKWTPEPDTVTSTGHTNSGLARGGQ